MKIKFLTILVFGFLLFCCTAKDIVKNADYWPTDAWKTNQPTKLGLDSRLPGKIEKFVNESLPKTSSVLIVRHGYLAYEKYFSLDAQSLRAMQSATKSVVSILFGILQNTRAIPTIDMPLSAFFKELDSGMKLENAKKISIKNLLTMTSGMPFDGGAGVTSINLVELLLSSPLHDPPGTVFAYNGTNINLLSMIITRTTNRKAAEFASEFLFKPLGIEKYSWTEQNGISIGAYGLMLTSRDMAKLGYLMLRKGNWSGTQIIAEEWVRQSSNGMVTTGAQRDYKENYGLLWWITKFGKYDAFYAYGLGGQTIAIVPELDLLIVITTNDSLDEGSEKYLKIITGFVLPAIVE